jgi:hypothetical protein
LGGTKVAFISEVRMTAMLTLSSYELKKEDEMDSNGRTFLYAGTLMQILTVRQCFMS